MTTSPPTPTAPCRSWLSRSRVRRHFAGRISPHAERALRRHLADCADCRSYYDRHLQLSLLDPQALPARERLARGLGVTQPRGSYGFVLIAAAAVMAGGLVLFFELPRSEREVAAFAARGSNGTLPFAPPASVRVYRHHGAEHQAVQGGFARDEELSFAYTNSAGYRYLLVAGVDEHGEVFWYYPAWQDAAANPSAIPIQSSSKLVELPDAVRHQLAGKHLRLLAIFTNEPLTVRQVEERISSQGASHEGLLFPGTLEQALSLEVR